MTKSKIKKVKPDKSFEREDAIIKQIQTNIQEAQKDGLNAPDILEELRRKNDSKKVAITNSNEPSI